MRTDLRGNRTFRLPPLSSPVVVVLPDPFPRDGGVEELHGDSTAFVASRFRCQPLKVFEIGSVLNTSKNIIALFT